MVGHSTRDGPNNRVKPVDPLVVPNSATSAAQNERAAFSDMPLIGPPHRAPSATVTPMAKAVSVVGTRGSVAKVAYIYV